MGLVASFVVAGAAAPLRSDWHLRRRPLSRRELEATLVFLPPRALSACLKPQRKAPDLYCALESTDDQSVLRAMTISRELGARASNRTLAR
jgi:hypothetical protein